MKMQFSLKLPVQSDGAIRANQKTITLHNFIFASAPKKGEGVPGKSCRRSNKDGSTTFGNCESVCKGLKVTPVHDGTSQFKCQEGLIDLQSAKFTIVDFISIWNKL